MSLGIEDRVTWGKELVSYSRVESDVEVGFTDGTTVKGRLVVGCDGMRSRVRGQLVPGRRMLDLGRWVMWGKVPLGSGLRGELGAFEGRGEEVVSWFMARDEGGDVQCVVEPMVWEKDAGRKSYGEGEGGEEGEWRRRDWWEYPELDI